METNFDYLLKKEEYADFAKQAVEAEKSLSISPATCAILSRRALELAVRFVFSYDAELSLPYRDNVSSLIHEPTFRRIIEPRLFPMLKYTIHLGNVAVHTNNKCLCLVKKQNQNTSIDSSLPLFRSLKELAKICYNFQNSRTFDVAKPLYIMKGGLERYGFGRTI